MSNPNLVPLKPDHLKQIAAVHSAAFPSSALTKLGPEIVSRYYEWQLNGPHDVVALGAKIDGDLAGFCFGGRFHGAMTGFLSKNRWYLAFRLFTQPWLIGLPEIRDRLQYAFRIIFKRPIKSQNTFIPYTTPSFGILSIAVNPTYQGKGIGKLLMRAEELAAIKRGFLHMHLTVSTKNNQAIRFYENLGWHKRVDSTGKWSGAMERTILDKAD